VLKCLTSWKVAATSKKTGVALCLNKVLLLKEPEICEPTLLSVKVPTFLNYVAMEARDRSNEEKLTRKKNITIHWPFQESPGYAVFHGFFMRVQLTHRTTFVRTIQDNVSHIGVMVVQRIIVNNHYESI
jgi:hypothetical protein